MTSLYLDCQAGIAGDMTVAALIDLGLPLEHLEAELRKLDLPVAEYHLAVNECKRQGIRALHFDVQASGDHSHRHYGDIVTMISGSALAAPVKETALKVFRLLGEAEATVHGVSLEAVHFHEVGAVDSIIDILSVSIGLDYFGVSRLFFSRLPACSGFVESAHGLLPLPAPATALLLTGVPQHDRLGTGERVTPTGAAIVAALASGFGMPDGFVYRQTGSGAGTKDFSDTANILRAYIGETPVCGASGRLTVMEANIDDCPGEVLGFAMEQLFAAGALDVWFTPIQMKKCRPGVTLSLLCGEDETERFARLLLAETTAIGVRHYPVSRTVLDRSVEERATDFGPIRFKVTINGAKPEFEDCRRVALETGLPLLEVYRRLKT